MPRSLVALGASAVAAIYVAGYARTQSADASLDDIATAVATSAPTTVATVQPSTAIAPSQRATRERAGQAPAQTAPSAPASTASGTAPNVSVATSPSNTTPGTTSNAAPSTSTAPAASTAPSTATQSTYKDGTYSGMGTSRRGNVWVDVTVNGGQIELVTITRSTLQYPVRDIAGLPAQVVAKQSAQVNIVSGATYSSQAFRTAVSQALQGARA
jgi:uncharacterized protein with FMN-binding domain/outer membrane murein-binding lipoprotein Lpp